MTNSSKTHHKYGKKKLNKMSKKEKKKFFMRQNKKIKNKKINKKCIKCMLFKNNNCNSDYGKGLVCDGLNPPNKCPYRVGGSFAMSVLDRKNWMEDKND